MISSKNWVSHRGLTRHYGISRGVEVVSVYSRSRKRRVVVRGEGAEAVRRCRVEVVERVCEDCSTRMSPQWRKGPSGPRSLCNACGIRYRREARRLQPNCDPIKCSSSSSTEEGLSYEELKQRQKEKQMKMLLLLDWTNKNNNNNNKERIREIKRKNPVKMGANKATAEDEEAALLLLSLSSAILLH